MERSDEFDQLRADGGVAPSPPPPIAQSSSHLVSGSTRRTAIKWISRVSRFFLVALFLFTAGAKLAIIKDFAEKMGQLVSSLGIDYVRWAWPFTIALIAAEIGIAVLLLVPRTIRIGALLSAAMLLGFAGFALYYVYVLNGEALECGCFGGIIGSQLGVKTALRNLCLLIPAVVVWFGYRKTQTGLKT